MSSFSIAHSTQSCDPLPPLQFEIRPESEHLFQLHPTEGNEGLGSFDVLNLQLFLPYPFLTKYHISDRSTPG